MSDVDDKELVRKSLDGDVRSFEQLIDAYQTLLFNFAYRMVNDFDDASDVTQTTFIKVHRNLRSFDPRHKFFSWIYRILLNESINLIKSRKAVEELEENLVARGPDPEESYESFRLGQRVEGALAKLSPDYRTVIVMRHFLDLPYEEIAKILDIPPKTVKSRLYTARQKLGRLLMRPAGAPL